MPGNPSEGFSKSDLELFLRIVRDVRDITTRFRELPVEKKREITAGFWHMLRILETRTSAEREGFLRKATDGHEATQGRDGTPSEIGLRIQETAIKRWSEMIRDLESPVDLDETLSTLLHRLSVFEHQLTSALADRWQGERRLQSGPNRMAIAAAAAIFVMSDVYSLMTREYSSAWSGGYSSIGLAVALVVPHVPRFQNRWKDRRHHVRVVIDASIPASYRANLTIAPRIDGAWKTMIYRLEDVSKRGLGLTGEYPGEVPILVVQSRRPSAGIVVPPGHSAPAIGSVTRFGVRMHSSIETP